jgi:hypothetical protein
LEDHLLDVPARRDAGIGQDFLDALFHVFILAVRAAFVMM